VSRWIHAVPLKNLKAETVADGLIDFFSYAGFPQCIKADNFQTFKGELFSALHKKLGVEMLFSAPYHSQSHGSIERANKTLEEILRKFLADHTRDWDTLIPYLLLALREIPNESTKYSPAQLVFGRQLRGLLAVVRDSWVNGDELRPKLKVSTVKYMETLNRSIEEALKAAGDNARQAQTKMKETYDRRSSQRALEPGELALVLLPTTANKLYAHWRGPYRVVARCENNNYELDLDGRRAKFHVNSLRRYNERQMDSAPAINMIVNETDGHEALTGMDSETGAPPDQQHAPPDGDETTEFCIGTQLTDAQQEAIRELLGRYADVFSDVPGTTRLVEHKITLTDQIPCYQPAYKIPEAMREPVERELTKMLENGVIQYDYETKYNSPLVIVKKPGGGIRLVNNFINLNKKTVNEQYTMTNPTELLNRAAGFKYISKMDQNSAYFQLFLTPESQRYTGFQTFMGPFSYRKLPMGLKCAASTFQRLMDIVLRGLHRFSGTLLDDTICFSRTFEDHLDHLRQVLDRLRDAGLTVNKNKCTFASNNIKIFGHVVVDGLIYPDDDKIAAIAAWTPPKTKKQLKSFLGFTGYFRDMIDRYSTKSYCLTELLGRTKPDKLVWTDEYQGTFDTLRTALMSRPVLRPPDIKKPFLIMADSSRTNISAVLMQSSDTDESVNHAVAYASRKLLDRETRYPTIEQELLAIVFALLKFKHFIYGCEIKIYSDHRPLAYLNSLVKHSPRLARWYLILLDFDVSTTYIKGKCQLADGLTRVE